MVVEFFGQVLAEDYLELLNLSRFLLLFFFFSENSRRLWILHIV